MTRTVLVTGVSRHLGGRFARLLTADPRVDRVIGVDVVPPDHDLGGAEFVRADIRNPIIAKVIAAADVDTVVHMSVIATPMSAGGRSLMKEVNVIGTMQLLAACQKAKSISRLVVKSSSTVYGASPKDPAMFTEDMEPKRLPRSGFAKDSVEVEGYVRGFSRRRPDVEVTMLRFANCVGPGIVTPLTAYFGLPLVPTVFGFDPRLQFVHEDDLLRSLLHSTLGAPSGTYNISGDGVILLSQAAHRAGRPTLPLFGPFVSTAGGLVRRVRAIDFSPEQVQFLTYGRGVDTTRMRSVLGFEPDYTTAQAFEDFVTSRRLNGLVQSDHIDTVERQILSLVSGPGTP